LDVIPVVTNARVNRQRQTGEGCFLAQSLSQIQNNGPVFYSYPEKGAGKVRNGVMNSFIGGMYVAVLRKGESRPGNGCVVDRTDRQTSRSNEGGRLPSETNAEPTNQELI
jgi:hypothetical protein